MKSKRWFAPLGALACLLLGLVSTSKAQTCTSLPGGAPYQIGLSCTFTSSSSPFPFPAQGLSYFQLKWVPNGTISAASVSLDSSSSNGGSYTTGGILAAGTIGSIATVGSYSNSSPTTPTYMGQITPTVTGTGSIAFTLYGFINNPATAGSSSAAITSPLDASNNVKVNCEVGCGGAGSNTPADTFSNPTNAVPSQSFPEGWNGTTWDRLRTASVGNAVAATGLLAHAVYCEYLSSLPTLTTGTYGASQCDSSGRLLVNVVSAPTTSVQPAGFGSLIGFQQAVTASAVALSSNASHSVCVMALPTNTINIYVGPSGVTTSTGIPLQPGQTACWSISNTNLLYVIASTTGASVAVTGV